MRSPQRRLIPQGGVGSTATSRDPCGTPRTLSHERNQSYADGRLKPSIGEVRREVQGISLPGAPSPRAPGAADHLPDTARSGRSPLYRVSEVVRAPIHDLRTDIL